MTGFLTGIAVNIVLGQVPDLAGAAAGGSVAVTKFFDVVANSSGVDRRALVTGVTALLVLVLAARTRLALFGSLLALVVPGDDGTLRERPAPRRLTAGQVLVLDVYGSLFYAGARTLQARLPDPADATNAEVILRLRGRTTFGATFFSVIRDHARRLDEENGRLYLSGIGAQTADDWGAERLAGQGLSLEVFPATETIGESTRRAFGAAERRRVRVTERAGG